jgi:hypothetical protein
MEIKTRVDHEIQILHLKTRNQQLQVPLSFSFFDSTRFRYIPRQFFLQLFDFVYIEKEPFYCDSVFALCLPQTIFDLK